MIKINLLNSVTERQASAVVAVDRKVASPGMRLLFMSLAVAFLLIALIGWDVISTQMNKAAKERQLEEQKQIAAELETVMKEQKELEDRIKNIDARIAAIKKLREEQRRPSRPPTSSTALIAASSGHRSMTSGGDTAHRIGTHRLSEARLDSSAAATAEDRSAGVSRARWPKPITAAVDDT